MGTPRIIAISGTPGSGKTSLCDALESAKIQCERLQELAQRYECLGSVDEHDGAAPVDIHRLAEVWEPPSSGLVMVDGHLAHLLDIEAIIVVRCEPKELSQRLNARGYDEAKIRANTEWELMAGTWAELLEFEVDLPVLELNSSEHSVEELASLVLEWVEKGCQALPLSTMADSAIDWLSQSE